MIAAFVVFLCIISIVFRSFLGWLGEAGQLFSPGRPASISFGGAL